MAHIQCRCACLGARQMLANNNISLKIPIQWYFDLWQHSGILTMHFAWGRACCAIEMSSIKKPMRIWKWGQNGSNALSHINDARP